MLDLHNRPKGLSNGKEPGWCIEGRRWKEQRLGRGRSRIGRSSLGPNGCARVARRSAPPRPPLGALASLRTAPPAGVTPGRSAFAPFSPAAPQRMSLAADLSSSGPPLSPPAADGGGAALEGRASCHTRGRASMPANPSQRTGRGEEERCLPARPVDPSPAATRDGRDDRVVSPTRRPAEPALMSI